MSVDKEAIDMTAQEWFEKDSMFTIDFLSPEERETIYKIMDLYAQGKTRVAQQEIEVKDKTIAELNRRVIELQQADMTHEYNNAEAERVWPQIKQQIIDEANEAKEKEIERLKGLIEKEFSQLWIRNEIGDNVYAGYSQSKAVMEAGLSWTKFKTENNL